MKAMVVGFIYTEDTKEVLLVKKLKPEWQRGKYNGIGGKIEPGELPKEAVVREFDEELKGEFHSKQKEWTLMVILVCSAGVVFFFRYPSLASLSCKEGIPKENDNGEKLTWFPIDSLPENIMTNLKWLVPFCFYQKLEAPVFVHEDMALYRDQDEDYLKRMGLEKLKTAKKLEWPEHCMGCEVREECVKKGGEIDACTLNNKEERDRVQEILDELRGKKKGNEFIENQKKLRCPECGGEGHTNPAPKPIGATFHCDKCGYSCAAKMTARLEEIREEMEGQRGSDYSSEMGNRIKDIMDVPDKEEV